MAAQDLQIQPRRSSNYLAQQQVVSQKSNLPGSASSEGSSLLVSALRRRWWMFLLIGLASAALAQEAMNYFGKDSSRSTAALIQTGLPGSPGGGEVIKPMAPATCAELIESFTLLNKLCESRGLEISPKILQELIETRTSRGSSLLNVDFAWSKAEDGVAMLNELLDIFVEEIASQRRRTLRDHMQHVENSLLQARAEVSDARQQIFEVQAEQQKVLDEGGLNSERYRSVLSSVTNTQLGVDEKRVEQLGVQQQIEVLQQKSSDLGLRVEQVLADFKTQLVRKIANRLKRVREQLTETSSAYAEMSDLIAEVQGFTESNKTSGDVQQWQLDLHALVTGIGLPLPEQDRLAIATDFEAQLDSFGPLLKQIDLDRQLLAKQQERLELSVIPLKNQIKMLETRLDVYQQQADEIGEQLTGIGADQYGAYELRLEQAEGQQKALSAQLENMSQLEKCHVREWSVSVPASMETTEVSSNRIKLFGLAFGLCGLVLSSPVLISEWYRKQASPQVAFANSLQLPVLAERILQDFAPRRRRMTVPKLSEEQLEIVRMLALRIQQSSHSDGSVVLFSSIDSDYSPAPLMASVAECLAQREEKVLMVDAVSPGKTSLPITNIMPMPEQEPTEESSQKTETADNESLVTHPGLAEYLTSGCETVTDLVRPTGCPGVDLISSGHSAFHREALASSSLTELVDQCRENYTMILVNSPSATASADLQIARGPCRRGRIVGDQGSTKELSSACGRSRPDRAWRTDHRCGCLASLAVRSASLKC